jgi:hypothetical protein
MKSEYLFSINVVKIILGVAVTYYIKEEDLEEKKSHTDED